MKQFYSRKPDAVYALNPITSKVTIRGRERERVVARMIEQLSHQLYKHNKHVIAVYNTHYGIYKTIAVATGKPTQHACMKPST